MNVRNYALVTAGYWAFTLTDGALRMLVLRSIDIVYIEFSRSWFLRSSPFFSFLKSRNSD